MQKGAETMTIRDRFEKAVLSRFGEILPKVREDMEDMGFCQGPEGIRSRG